MSAMNDNVDLVRHAWDAALRGDLDAVGTLLADDVRWHGAGDPVYGCHDRAQTLRWLREVTLARGPAEVLEMTELDEHRVLVVIQRADEPEPHAQVLTVRDGKIAEAVVYPTREAALAPVET
jgi:ketosteroid isomerase-like protein